MIKFNGDTALRDENLDKPEPSLIPIASCQNLRYTRSAATFETFPLRSGNAALGDAVHQLRVLVHPLLEITGCASPSQVLPAGFEELSGFTGLFGVSWLHGSNDGRKSRGRS